ncbi:MAG: hypothetical protein ACOWWO_11945 [Peptococcaceae bacterium]
MPDLTTRLGLKKPLGNETFTRQSYNENLDLLDQNAETPDGAQAKATAAETAAKVYTDQEVGSVQDEIGAHKADEAINAHTPQNVGLSNVPNIDFRNYGLGSSCVHTANLNDLTASGFYKISSTDAPTGNAPNISGAWEVIHWRYDSNSASQIAQSAGGDETTLIKLYIRNKGSGAWTPWQEVLHTGTWNPFGNQISIGENSEAAGAGMVAIGRNVKALLGNGVGIGEVITAPYRGIRIGRDASAEPIAGDYAIGLGWTAKVEGYNAIAIGRNAIANAANAIALGENATIALDQSGGIALGANTDAAQDAVAVGAQAQALYNRSVAIGREATTSKNDEIVLGREDGACDVRIPGKTIVGNNTAYTTKQARNIILSTADPSGTPGNGDIFIKYKP